MIFPGQYRGLREYWALGTSCLERVLSAEATSDVLRTEYVMYDCNRPPLNDQALTREKVRRFLTNST